MGISGATKRAIVGRKLRSTQLNETLLPKRIALPVFASDALSSVAYAPDEIFLTLSIGGLSAYTFNWKIGIAVALVLAIVWTDREWPSIPAGLLIAALVGGSQLWAAWRLGRG